LSEKEKNVDDYGSTHKKNRKRKKSRAKKWSLKKNYISSNKKTNCSADLPILLETRKEGCQCNIVFIWNP